MIALAEQRIEPRSRRGVAGDHPREKNCEASERSEKKRACSCCDATLAGVKNGYEEEEKNAMGKIRGLERGNRGSSGTEKERLHCGVRSEFVEIGSDINKPAKQGIWKHDKR